VYFQLTETEAEGTMPLRNAGKYLMAWHPRIHHIHQRWYEKLKSRSTHFVT